MIFIAIAFNEIIQDQQISQMQNFAKYRVIDEKPQQM